MFISQRASSSSFLVGTTQTRLDSSSRRSGTKKSINNRGGKGEREGEGEREEEMEKQISFMMRVLSNVPEGSKNAGPERPGFSPIRETLILSMRRYLEYLAKDLGDLNEGLIECMRVFKDHPELIPGYGVNRRLNLSRLRRSRPFP